MRFPEYLLSFKIPGKGVDRFQTDIKTDRWTSGNYNIDVTI